MTTPRPATDVMTNGTSRRMPGRVRGAALALCVQVLGACSGADAQIADRLRSRGIDIARRTVAKYRMQLDILPSSLR